LSRGLESPDSPSRCYLMVDFGKQLISTEKPEIFILSGIRANLYQGTG
jgi:hypothetical protein